MKGFVRGMISSVLLFLSLQSNAQFTYINPMPGSKLHNAETGIILKTGKLLDATSLHSDLITVSGSLSGTHEVKIKLAGDNKTILIQPLTAFSGGEKVTVVVKNGLRNRDGSLVNGISFNFETHPIWTPEQRQQINKARRQERIDEYGLNNYESMFEHQSQGKSPLLVCNFLPPFTIASTPGAYVDEPVFYRNFRSFNALCFTSTIISSSGDSIYSDQDDDAGTDFKINDNGYITYYNTLDSTFHMLDSSYNLVKTLAMGNGYNADEHECRVYPDGTTLLLCYDTEIMDMTAYGGQPNASVTGLVVQELDGDGNVIFEWSSWDHFLITDTDDNINLTLGTVDLVHGNSLDLDYDGNLLLSSRHLDEITKIDLSTGDIIWRMGGKNNQFSFVNDSASAPLPFSFQHHFRRLSNGHYTMFDNGNHQSPEVSIAKEWSIDETNKIATLVWSYQHPQVNGNYVMGLAMGSVEVLPNGNRFIDWGLRKNLTAGGIPNFTEVDSLGNIVWEFWFKDSTYVSYRAFKRPWDRCGLIDSASLYSDSITLTSANLHWGTNAKISGFVLQYKKCSELDWISVPLDTTTYKLEGLQSNTCYQWRVQSICSIYDDSSFTIIHQFNTHNPLGVQQLSSEENYFVLFPNPASGQTELRFTSASNSSSEITMFNILGGIVMQQNIFAHAGENSLNLDLKKFSAGTYTIELSTANTTLIRKLVIH